MNIYSPIQLAFIKFLQSAISKNKKYGYLNLTNKEIAERFEFCKRKYSKRTIEELLIQVKPEFQIIGNTKRRFILPKDSTSITTPFTHHSHTIKPVLPHHSHSINTLANPESLEPQGIQDPLLIDKNQDQLIINKFKKKEKDKKEKEISTREESTSVDVPFSLEEKRISKTEEEFNTAYQAYGRALNRNKKKESFVRWQELKRKAKLPALATILQAIELFKKSLDPDDPEKFKPGFQVWLNQERWQDVEDFTQRASPIRTFNQEIEDARERERRLIEKQKEYWGDDYERMKIG